MSRIQTSCPTYECVRSHTHMTHVTHTIESRHTHERVMSHRCRNKCGRGQRRKMRNYCASSRWTRRKKQQRSVLQCVAVCCSVLQCVAIIAPQAGGQGETSSSVVSCSVLRCVAVCCGVLQSLCLKQVDKERHAAM